MVTSELKKSLQTCTPEPYKYCYIKQVYLVTVTQNLTRPCCMLRLHRNCTSLEKHLCCIRVTSTHSCETFLLPQIYARSCAKLLLRRSCAKQNRTLVSRQSCTSRSRTLLSRQNFISQIRTLASTVSEQYKSMKNTSFTLELYK